jgi:DNA replication protein DnaC
MSALHEQLASDGLLQIGATTAHAQLDSLAQQAAAHHWSYLKMLTTPKLLIVDEVGYLGLDHDQASLLFQVICQRYEKQAATIITSNKAFSDWGHVFAGDAVMASAALDRLLHRATVVNIKGESYRMKEKRLTGLFPGRASPTA